MKRIIAAVLFVLVTLAGCQASRGGDDDAAGAEGTSASNEPRGIGEPVEVEQPGGGEVSTVTVHSATWYTEGQGQYAPAPQQGAYLVVDVEWSGDGSYNPMYFTFRSESGAESNAISGAMAGFEPSLSSGDLAGGTVRGFVVFDAAQSAGQLIVTDTLLQHAGMWTIPAA